MKFFTRLLFVLSLCFIGRGVFGQSADYQLSGTITDPDQQALAGATVVAMNPADSTLLAFAISDGKGRFSLNRITLADITLQITYIGYGSFQQLVSFTAEAPHLDLGEIWLSPENLLLEEVVVKGEHIPVLIKGDTIQYQAGAFSVRADDNVERLLKQLPGVEVARDGSIKAQGEDVKNVLVDGKPFFGNNPQVATRNLPADAVESVQVYDEASELEEFSGIDDGEEEKTINLVLKEDKKAGQFGEITAGYGSDGRYEGKASVNRFSGQSQLSLLGSANNINEPGFSIFDYIDFLGGFGNLMEQGGGSIQINDDDLGVPLNFGDGGGLNTSQALGLNYNRDFGEHTTFSSNYFGSILKRDLQESFTRNNVLAEEEYRSIGQQQENSRTSGHRVNLELEHELGERQRILFGGNIGYTDGHTSRAYALSNFTNADLLASDSRQDYRNTPLRWSARTSQQYFLKFKTTGRLFTAGLSYDRQNSDGEQNLLNRDRFWQENSMLYATDSLDQRQLSEEQSAFWQAKLAFTEPLNENWYWQNTLTLTREQADLDKVFLDRTETLDYQRNLMLSGVFDRTFSTSLLGTGLLYTSHRSRFDIAVQAQYGDLQSGVNTANAFWYLLPRASWKHEFTSSRNLELRYSTRLNAPGLSQLQTLVDNTNSLNIYEGNPELAPEYQHDFTAGLTIIDAFSFTNFFANLRSSYIDNRIVNRLSIDDLLRQVRQPVNSDYEWQNQLYASFSTPLRIVDVSLQLRGSTSYNRGQLLVNETTDRAERWQQEWSLSFRNRKQEVVAWELGAAWNFSQARYEQQDNFNQNYSRQDWFVSADWFMPKDWVLSTEMEHQQFSDEAFGQQNGFTLWQASVRKSFLAGKRLTLKLSVFDLLNQNRGLERRNAFNYFEESQANALGRFAMLTATYKLSKVNSEG